MEEEKEEVLRGKTEYAGEKYTMAARHWLQGPQRQVTRVKQSIFSRSFILPSPSKKKKKEKKKKEEINTSYRNEH